MTHASRRWGIDLIGALYLLASLFVLLTFRDPNRLVMTFVTPMAILMLALGAGLLARIQVAQTVLVGLLWFSLIASGLFCLLYISQIIGLVGEIPALEPKRTLLRTVFRMSIAWYTVSYLTRPDVKAEFAA